MKYGHWKDSAIQVRGEAAWSMTVMFLTLWDYVREKATEDYDAFRPRSCRRSRPRASYSPIRTTRWTARRWGRRSI